MYKRQEVVYTNVLSAGAYRGYGATQGIFAVESAVNELAHKLDIDPIKLREMNMVREGDLLTNYFGEVTNSCNLDKCVAKVKEMIGWDEKYPYVKTGPHTVRSVGMAMAMQGSGIGGVDVGSVQLKLNDDGFYTLMIGCSDMGTGCDTILAQMAADGLGCEFDDIIVRGVDTDQSPYDLSLIHIYVYKRQQQNIKIKVYFLITRKNLNICLLYTSIQTIH